MTDTETNLYEAAQPQKTSRGTVDTPELMITAEDPRATLRKAETLGDWSLRNGHHYDRVFAEYMAGDLWPQRRMNDGRLSVDYVERLQREIANRGALLVRDTDTEDAKE